MNQAVRSASAAAAAAHPRDLGLSANGLQRLRQVLLREIDQKRLPGAVATIARQGKLGFLEAFGVQEPAGGARIEIDSIFRIDSMDEADRLCRDDDACRGGVPIPRRSAREICARLCRS